MKEIIAIIRMNMINPTKEACVEAGVSGFTVRKVLGRGKGNVDFRTLQGAEKGSEEAIAQLGIGPRLIPKRMISIVVGDDLVAPLVQAIIRVNKTGNRGDGKIFIRDIIEAARIRTGERGAAALSEK